MYAWYVGGVPKRVTITLSSAQILALNSTPITTVAAPGSGYAVRVLRASASFNNDGDFYNTGDLYLSTNTLNTDHQVRTLNNFLANAGSGSAVHQFMQAISSSSADETQISENAALKVFVPSANPTSGTATVTLYVTYEIVAL